MYKRQSDGTLVLAETGFEGKFSPFFASSASDQDVIDLTQLGLLGADRKGEMILNGIEGETRSYNGTDYTYYGPADIVVTKNEDGTVTYDVTMRDDIVFSVRDNGVGMSREDLESTLGTDSPEERMVEHIALREAIDQLPEREKMTILLRFFKGLTQEQTARILGVSQVQISRLERRGLADLRRLLDG